MVRTENLYFEYNRANAFTFPDLEYNNNEPFLILGKSGCGKTTMLHLLAGLLKPKKGKVFIGDTIINKLSSKKLDAFRATNIGIVFQRPHLVKALTVKANLELSTFFAKKAANNNTKALLEQLGIADKLLQKPHQLSQGEQQRVAIARAVIKKPQLILADEPTASLDDTNCEKVIDLLTQQAQLIDAQLIIVTHDQRLKDIFTQKLELKM